jgi:type II secretory pathway pseudopilin PulG
LNNRGVTLLELVIYIALFAGVAILIGRQMQSSTKGFMHGKEVLSVQSESRDLMAMISRDIKNTGLKSYLVNIGSNDYSIVVENDAYYADGSSFQFTEGDPGDQLTIRRARFDQNGTYLGQVDSVKFTMRQDSLIRNENNIETVLATQVKALQFRYGVLGKETSVGVLKNFASSTSWSYSSGVSASVSGTPASLKLDITTTGAKSATYGTAFVFDTSRLRIDFWITAVNNFADQLDSIRWSLKTGGGSVLGSERFLPVGCKSVIIPVIGSGSGMLSLDMWPKATGMIIIDSVKITQTDWGKYIWKDAVTLSEKRMVKSIRIFVLMNSDDPVNSFQSSGISVANVTITPTASERKSAWRLLSETVDVPNNGLF